MTTCMYVKRADLHNRPVKMQKLFIQSNNMGLHVDQTK